MSGMLGWPAGELAVLWGSSGQCSAIFQVFWGGAREGLWGLCR
jgi:hypothetical protein